VNDRTDAKELLHIKAWLERAAEVVAHGREAYLSDDLLQEAGDSLMMKLGEAANRLARRGVGAPAGVDWAVAVANRNFIIHRYDEISRELTRADAGRRPSRLGGAPVWVVRAGREDPAGPDRVTRPVSLCRAPGALDHHRVTTSRASDIAHPMRRRREDALRHLGSVS
jgi:uncharacterized protein with HEPN domain